MRSTSWVKLTLCAACILACLTFSRTAFSADKLLPAEPQLLSHYMDTLESEIASRIVQRSSVPSAGLAQLEMQIDVRIIVRWMIQQAMDRPSGSDLQVVAYLRSLQMIQVVDLFNEELNHLAGSQISSLQIEAMTQLHELTFRLAEPKSAAMIDDVSRAMGRLLLAIVRPDTDPKTLPPMRPKLRTTPTSGSSGNNRELLMQLEAQARQATVSVALREQLLALWNQVDKAERDDSQKDQVASMLEVLRSAVELARGLEANTGVTSEAREEMENRLLDGVALYLDTRTRDAGAGRITGLRNYQQLLSQIDGLQLTSDDRTAVAPALAYARQEPSSAAQILHALDRFATAQRHYAALTDPSDSIANLDGIVKQLRQQYLQKVQDFLGLAGKYSRSFDVSPNDFEAAAISQYELVELIEAIGRMPQVVYSLSTYSVRQLDLLQRRIQTAAAKAVQASSDESAAAAESLRRLARLMNLAAQLDQSPTFPEDLSNMYLGANAQSIRRRWRDAVLKQANQFIAARPIEPQVLTQMQWLIELYDAIDQAQPAEAVITQADGLSRWVDWNLSVTALETVFGQYRNATAEFAVRILGDATDKDHAAWQKQHQQSRPLFALMEQTQPYVSAVKSMPQGFTGAVAGLLTPMNGQAFAAQRYASYAFEVWAIELNSGSRSADATGRLIIDRLRNLLNLPL